MTGLIGAGRTEVCEAIYGVTPRRTAAGSLLEGEELRVADPAQAIEKGIGYLPEDRLRQGLVLDWELSKNVTLPTLGNVRHLGLAAPEEGERRHQGARREAGGEGGQRLRPGGHPVRAATSRRSSWPSSWPAR